MPPTRRQIDDVFTKLSPLLILCPDGGDIDLALKHKESISEQVMYWINRVQQLRKLPGGKEAYEQYHAMSNQMEHELRNQASTSNGQKGIAQERNGNRGKTASTKKKNVGVSGKTATATKKNKAKPGARAPVNITDRQKEIGMRFKTQMKESKSREW